MIPSEAMDAAAALADLVEISPQIEAAAVVDQSGEMAGSVGVPEARASVLARSVRELLDGAAAFRSDQGRVTQLHAELAGGDLFAVADGGQAFAVRAKGQPGGRLGRSPQDAEDLTQGFFAALIEKNTLAAAEEFVTGPARQGMAIMAGVKAVLDTFRSLREASRRRTTAARPTVEEEESLFIG